MTFVIRNMFVMVGLLMVGLLGACSNMPDKAGQAAPAKPATADAATRQYTFGWKFTEGGNLTPRGGESKGVPVTLDSKPSAAWLKLQEPGISDFERDRRAILAMAGEFRTSFDFVEVAGFTPGYKPPAPYQTWATEKVYVLEDKGDFISLQHILVTRDVADDGRVLTPVVTKHWRQDWQYQPASMLVYRGQNAWQKQDISAAERKGAWSQTVYQVDDSPRYADVAPWQHFGNYSSWSTQDVWRPLPRREYTVRSDYQLLMGSNRHIILPTGWVHEQQNNKVVLGADGKPLAKDPVLAREIGFNRYERITGYDFTPGRCLSQEHRAVLERSAQAVGGLEYTKRTGTAARLSGQESVLSTLVRLCREAECGQAIYPCRDCRFRTKSGEGLPGQQHG